MDTNGFINKYNPTIKQFAPIYYFTVVNLDESKLFCEWTNDNLKIVFGKIGGTIIWNKATTVDKIDAAIAFVQQYLDSYNQL